MASLVPSLLAGVSDGDMVMPATSWSRPPELPFRSGWGFCTGWLQVSSVPYFDSLLLSKATSRPLMTPKVLPVPTDVISGRGRRVCPASSAPLRTSVDERAGRVTCASQFSQHQGWCSASGAPVQAAAGQRYSLVVRVTDFTSWGGWGTMDYYSPSSVRYCRRKKP